MTRRTPHTDTTDQTRGLAQGGLGGPEDELLDAGQEEVFSRTEVEQGVSEHHRGEETPGRSP
ncbi:hypothetical protein [Brevundimonas sp. C43]|uniref:hypothetical protein n=1 Tax=Brevundimonas sp. C43 TaxID=3068314 RepID=UPI00273D0349|nr:hypothetical protein [Brevundimonas sp. C43]